MVDIGTRNKGEPDLTGVSAGATASMGDIEIRGVRVG